MQYIRNLPFPETLNNISHKVRRLVIQPDIMNVFRKNCKDFYDKLKKNLSKYEKEIIANHESPGQLLSDDLVLKLRKEDAKDNQSDLIDILFFPHIFEGYIPKMSNRLDMFIIKEDSELYDKKFSVMADYVRLAVLSDNLDPSPCIEPINNGIWPENERWEKELFKQIIEGSKIPEIVSYMRWCYRYVEADLQNQIN